MERVLQHYGSSVRRLLQPFMNSLRHISVTSAFIVVTLSLLALSAIMNNTNSHESTSRGLQSDSNAPIEGTQPSQIESIQPESGEVMPTQEKDSNIQNMQITESENNNSSTVVTINGDSVTVPNGETYNDSYIAESAAGTTRVYVSIDNNSSSSTEDVSNSNVRERSRVHIRSESSSSSHH